MESLEWYKAAVRSNRPDERGMARILSWLKGVGFLTAHISVFAVGIVVLLVINLLRSPEDLWVDRAGAAWALLLVIHGVAIGLIWAIELLLKDDDEALQVVPSSGWQNTSAPWPQTARMVSPTGAQQQGANPVPAGNRAELAAQSALRPTPPATDGQQGQPVPPGWSAWGRGVEQSPPPDEPKASWKEAATWLTRSGRARPTAPTERPHSDPPAPDGSSSR